MAEEDVPKANVSSRRTFLKIGAGVAGGLIVGGAVAYLAKPSTTSTQTITGSNSTVISTVPGSGSTVTVTGTSSGPSQPTGVLTTLSTTEASVLEAAAETIIPSDSSGPGAKEAGAIYFIDGQLNGSYGRGGNMYNAGPYVLPNTAGPLTVDGVTYSAGSMTSTNLNDGYGYQYPVDFRNFWKMGLEALNAYAQSAYNNTFYQLSTTDRAAALTDLFNNKPTSFNNIKPSDFAWELFFMVWSGFLMDPMYGGNQNMVGWDYTAFSGINNGNFYGEGQTYMSLMVSSTPMKLKPVSLAQFQASSGFLPTVTSTSSSSSSSGGSSSSGSGSSSSSSGSSASSSSGSSSSGSA